MRDAYPEILLEDLSDAPKPMGKPVKLSIFVEASLASLKDNMSSVTGIDIFIGDMLFRYSSKRQKSIVTSTYSAEFVALRHAVEEAQAAKFLLQSIGVNIDGPVNIYSDNESVLKSAQTPGNELKRRHVAIAYHAVREAYATGLVDLFHISGTDNPADVLTKPLGRILFFKHTNRMLRNPDAENKNRIE